MDMTDISRRINERSKSEWAGWFILLIGAVAFSLISAAAIRDPITMDSAHAAATATQTGRTSSVPPVSSGDWLACIAVPVQWVVSESDPDEPPLPHRAKTVRSTGASTGLKSRPAIRSVSPSTLALPASERIISDLPPFPTPPAFQCSMLSSRPTPGLSVRAPPSLNS